MEPNQNTDPRILSIFGQLDNSVQSLTRRLEAMQARDLDKEFAYREANVGVTKSQVTFPKMDSWDTLLINGVSQYAYSAQLYPKIWRFTFVNMGNTLLTAAVQTNTIFLQVEFDNDPNFGQPKICLALPDIKTNPTSYTANTGSNLSFIDREFPVQYRHARATLFRMAASQGRTAIDPVSYLGGIYSRLTVNVLGE